MRAMNLLLTAALLSVMAGLMLPAMAHAAQQLTELDGFPFSLAVEPGLKAQLLPVTDPAGYAAAAAFPHTVTEFDVISLQQSKGGNALKLIFGRTGGKFGSRASAMQTQLAFTSGDDSKASLIGDKNALLPGVVNRVCVWLSGSDLVVLFTMANGSRSDGPVYGVLFPAGAAPRILDTGGAQALYGGFDVVDLDNDGRFELITARSLDGMAGGFQYHAVRTFANAAYTAQPDAYKAFFQRELDFLNWVVATRDKIQADPQPYLSSQLAGYAYVAQYEKEDFGFDSIVELPPGAGGKFDVVKYNQTRHDAFQRVKTYRDELQAWLGGGPHPPSWRLAR